MALENEKYAIGLMSGTSLDGLDVVYVRFFGQNRYEIIHAKTYAYPKQWLDVLGNVAKIPKGSFRLKDLDVALGKYVAERVVLFIADHYVKKVDFIASHGHTVHHVPSEGYTLQIGSGREIFNKIEVPVVYNFREQDVYFGGQGAPLVPIGDQFLFPEYEYCLNLGGFSNVSFLGKNGERKAFDICPVNTVLNYYAQKLGFDYDDKGDLSRNGLFCFDLFAELNQIDFYKQDVPKSLGVEFLEVEIFPRILKYHLSEIDVLRTFVEHIAYQISKKLKKGKVLVTGGGAYHQYLLERIKQLNQSLDLVLPVEQLIDYKEAMVFAYLGKLRLEGENNCLSSVTGALKDHSSGVIIT